MKTNARHGNSSGFRIVKETITTTTSKWASYIYFYFLKEPSQKRTSPSLSKTFEETSAHNSAVPIPQRISDAARIVF